MHGECDATIDTDSRIEDPIEISECYGTLWHLIDQKTQRVPLQIQQHSDGAARCDAALHATLVYGIVLEPRALSIDIHGKGLLIFAWNEIGNKRNIILVAGRNIYNNLKVIWVY